ncbi:hypothetical protein BMI90_18430 [Thioclava sp. L04-15]|nr:hypothetical protein BMI90_18430 [Thioclava sp. L04-15]
MQSKAAGVDVHLSEYDESGQTRASFGGLQTCGNVWQCPACAARISETRRRQLNDGLAWAREQGHRIAMITLTARHGQGDDLADLLRAMKSAKRRLHQHRAWKRIKPEIVAVLTATEVTHGRNGWHPHFHMLVIVRTKAAFEALAELGDPWRGALRAEDLDGAAAAFDCQGASAAGRYIGKWGAAEELTLSGKKRAKNKGRTPLQLLEACKAGNEEAGELWLEYADAFHGRTQLDGLKKLTDLAGLEEISDEEAAQDAEQEGQQRQDEPIANIDADTWRAKARHRRTDILDAAEERGGAGVWEVIDGPAKSRDLSRPPPPRPGGLLSRIVMPEGPRYRGKQDWQLERKERGEDDFGPDSREGFGRDPRSILVGVRSGAAGDRSGRADDERVGGGATGGGLRHCASDRARPFGMG